MTFLFLDFKKPALMWTTVLLFSNPFVPFILQIMSHIGASIPLILVVVWVLYSESSLLNMLIKCIAVIVVNASAAGLLLSISFFHLGSLKSLIFITIKLWILNPRDSIFPSSSLNI